MPVPELQVRMFQSIFFRLTIVWDSPQWHNSQCLFFPALYGCPQFIYPVSRGGLLFPTNWLISSYLLLWIKQPWAISLNVFCGWVIISLGVKILSVKLLGHRVGACYFEKNCQTGFQNGNILETFYTSLFTEHFTNISRTKVTLSVSKVSHFTSCTQLCVRLQSFQILTSA